MVTKCRECANIPTRSVYRRKLLGRCGGDRDTGWGMADFYEHTCIDTFVFPSGSSLERPTYLVCDCRNSNNRWHLGGNASIFEKEKIDDGKMFKVNSVCG